MVIDLLKIDADAGKHWQDVGFDKKRVEIRATHYARARAAWLAKKAATADAFDPGEERDQHGEWTSGGGTVTEFHGTSSAALKSISKKGLLVRKGVNSKKAGVYVTKEIEVARDYAMTAAPRDLLHPDKVSDVFPVILEVNIPSDKFAAFKTLWMYGHDASSTDRTIPPGWIAGYHTFDKDTGKIGKLQKLTHDAMQETVYAVVDLQQYAASGVHDAFDPDEERDDHGRWGAGGSGKSAAGKPGADHPGHGYSVHAHLIAGVIHTPNVYDATRALSEDREVELEQPREVSTLIKHLGEVAKHMIDLGEAAPHFNLCNVSVAGTNLFCAQSKGIPRVQMPQLDSEQTKAFRKYLEAKGYAVEKTKELSSHLRATQDELDGAKVAAVAAKLKADPDKAKRLIVSRDNYILDGHHHWAAEIGLDAKDNKFDGKTKISRVDISITQLLREAEKFTGGKGHKNTGDAYDPDEPRDPQGRWGAGSAAARAQAKYGEDWPNIVAQKLEEQIAHPAPAAAAFVAAPKTATAIRHTCARFAAKHALGFGNHVLKHEIMSHAVAVGVAGGLSFMSNVEPMIALAVTQVASYVAVEVSHTAHLDIEHAGALLASAGHAIIAAHVLGEPDDLPGQAHLTEPIDLPIGDAASDFAKELASLRLLAKAWDAMTRDAFNPDEPRDDGGRWGSGGTAYHGSHDPAITSFDRTQGTAAQRGVDSASTIGTWFTTSKEDARGFGPHVYAAQLGISKPLVVQGWDGLQAIAAKQKLLHTSGDHKGQIVGSKMRAWLIKQGYDGVHMKGGEDNVPGLDYVIALHADQIKNATREPATREELERLGADTLDRMAFGHANGDVVDVHPSQIKIQYPQDLVNPQARFDDEGMAWAKSVDLSEPVDVDIKTTPIIGDHSGTGPAEMYLADGHHRWFAAAKTGRTLKARIEIKAKPIEMILARQGASR
jgi:hypothetical protein